MTEAGDSASHAGHSRPLALVVDDADLNRLFVEFLEHAGYRAIPAYAGEEALRLAATRLPDVVLLDLMLPQQNGLEVARWLRRSASTACIPIVATSSSLEMIPTADASLFDARIAKPFELETLLDVLRRALSTDFAV